jgi:peptidoglycan hydrolase-like protein with peptidoglycan-binding domain
MTAATLAHLPLQVGGVALSQAGQAALWVIQRYMRAPLNNTAILALVVTTAMAGSNALYGQQTEHPSPLFAPVEQVTTGSIGPMPVVPVVRPKSLAITETAAEQAQAAPAAPAAQSVTGPVGNKDVFALQQKLAELNMFAGEIDGYYGPQTAGAIRRFEEANGLRVLGELNREVINRILAAPAPGPVTAPAASAAPVVAPAQPATVTLPQTQSAPVEQEMPAAAPQRQPLAQVVAPKPLATAGTRNMPTVLGRPVPQSAEAAFEMATETASEALETIVDGVQAIAMNNPPRQAAPPVAATQPLVTDTTARAALPATPQAQPMVAALPDSPRVGVPLQIDEAPPKPGEAIAVLETNATPDEVRAVSVTDPVVVAKIQRGLASLGFLHGPADGVAGAATAKAIRNFEVYFNYQVTGRITPGLLDLLLENGAVI